MSELNKLFPEKQVRFPELLDHKAVEYREACAKDGLTILEVEEELAVLTRFKIGTLALWVSQTFPDFNIKVMYDGMVATICFEDKPILAIEPLLGGELMLIGMDKENEKYNRNFYYLQSAKNELSRVLKKFASRQRSVAKSEDGVKTKTSVLACLFFLFSVVSCGKIPLGNDLFCHPTEVVRQACVEQEYGRGGLQGQSEWNRAWDICEAKYPQEGVCYTFTDQYPNAPRPQILRSVYAETYNTTTDICYQPEEVNQEEGYEVVY